MPAARRRTSLVKALAALALVALVALALYALGDLRARPPGALGVCPDTPRELRFELAAHRANEAHVDAVERAGRTLAAGREPDPKDHDAYCASELVASCEAPPDLVALTASIAAERRRIAADRARLESCDYLRE